MALKKTAEEKAAKEAAKQQRDTEKAEQERHEDFERAWRGFWASPAGEARRAFANGDQVFQYAIDVMNQNAIIVAMVGSTTRREQAIDPTAVLNTVCHEGWGLVNGDFVFVMTGQQSRDKFLSSGQNIAVAGTVMGYYLFNRNETNRVAETEEELRRRLAGWDDPRLEAAEDEVLMCPECGQEFPDLASYTAHYEAQHQDQGVAT